MARDEGRVEPQRQALSWRDLLAWLSLAGAVLGVCWPLGLTNRILAGVDAFTYFLPYWALRSAELNAGRWPLWNPYLFLGAPFLANPQAAVLYPLHWLLNGLAAERALIWSALLHLWLAGGLMFAFGRRSLGLGRSAAWLAGLLWALGGFALGKIENINQLNAFAWLPGLLWCLDETRLAVGWRDRSRWAVGLSMMIASQVLAGHTQAAFINMVGLGIYALAGPWPPLTGRPRLASRLNGLVPLAAVLPALGLAAGQLLPTLELNGLGLRTAGLTYRLAVSFSLRPRLLAQTFLPPYAGGLAEAFGSEGYAEFIGHVGVVGLILAAVGVAALWSVRHGRAEARPAWQARRGLAILALVGVFLALGAYNPFYYLLWRFVPGFDLFRAPARWLALYAVAAAGLAGVGLDVWLRPRRGHDCRPPIPFAVMRRPWLIVVLVAFALFAASQQLPATQVLVGWAAVAAAVFGLAALGRRWPVACRAGLVGLALVELWLAGRALPFAQATAPAATALRNAPAALLAATADQPPAGRDRFLSMSDIRYDPGDLAGLRALQADRLPPEAVERFVRAAKWVEVIAPNLSMALRLPAVDGYDGGILPTADYGRLQELFVPAETRLPDGRLREQLRRIPPDRLLDLTGVRFVITDKQRDLWADDVYYDLEQTVTLSPAGRLVLDLATYPPFAATALGIVAAADAPGEADVWVSDAHGQTVSLRLARQPTDDAAQPVMLAFGTVLTPTMIIVEAAGTAGLTLRGLSLYDGRTAAHQSITLSPAGDLRRIHSGDVKIYERVGAAGRAWLVHGAIPVREQEEAWRLLADRSFEPRQTVLLAADVPWQSPAAALPDEFVRLISCEAERIVLEARVSQPAFLVLADAYYPGWTATVDGVATPIMRANAMFRAVALPPGLHEVVFVYAPASWRWGRAISLATLALLALVWAATSVRRARVRHSDRSAV